MSLKWTMEAVWAGVAVIVTVGGTFYTHVFGLGATDAKVQAVMAHQADEDKRLDGHDARLSAQEQNSAASAQALKDIKEQLDRIEKKL